MYSLRGCKNMDEQKDFNLSDDLIIQQTLKMLDEQDIAQQSTNIKIEQQPNKEKVSVNKYDEETRKRVNKKAREIHADIDKKREESSRPKKKARVRKPKKERKPVPKKEKRRSNLMYVLANAEKFGWWMVIKIPVAIIMDILHAINSLCKVLLAIACVLIVVAAVLCFAAFLKIKPTFDEFNKEALDYVNAATVDTFVLEEASYIYDSEGKVLAKLRGGQDSAYLQYEDIPIDAINAFVAVEDRTFWQNPGFDIGGIIRVMVDFVETRGEEMHGASTITQQLARNIFLSHEVSIERKAKEILISYYLTNKFTKEQIIEFYINDICYANGIYGLEAASLAYFDKHADELSLSQICYLCAIPNSPSYYDPYVDPDRAIVRRDKILGDMLEMEYITQEEYDEAINEKITIEKQTFEFNDYQTTFAVNCAVRYLMEQNGFKFKYTFEDDAEYSNYSKEYDVAYEDAKNQLYTGGYKVYTTLDSEVQVELQAILDENLSFDEEVNEETGIYALQGAITCIDNSNGKVIALIGGRSQDDDSKSYSLNRAYQSYRQPGSSIKPLIVYAPALEAGYNPDSIVEDISIDAAKEPGADVQSLHGNQMTLREALTRSRNGVAWKLFDEITPKVGLSFITAMHYSKVVPDDYYNSASLGGFTYGVTTVEQASGFATLANHGEYREPTCISKIIDRNGDDIFRDSSGKQIYSSNTADTMVDMMQDVITKGTAAGMKWSSSSELPAAGKTGTTNDSKDGWFCGVTPYYSIAVWVGYDQPRTLDNLWGSTYPAQIWKQSMLDVTEGLEVIDFEELEDSGPTMLGSQVLPQSAYENYLPGRDDSEELSDGYYVSDYRADRIIGEDVQAIMNQMSTLNVSSSTYLAELQSLYNQGLEVIDTIYSVSYTSEMTVALNNVYNECVQKYTVSQTPATPTPQDTTEVVNPQGAGGTGVEVPQNPLAVPPVTGSTIEVPVVNGLTGQ